MSNADDIAYQEMRISYGENFKYLISATGITAVAAFLALSINPLLAALNPFGIVTLLLFQGYSKDKHRLKIQDARNRVAERILKLVKDHKSTRNYFLYLRPFVIQADLGMSSLHKHVKFSARLSSGPKVTTQTIGELVTDMNGDIELQLADVLWSQKLPLIAAFAKDDETGEYELPYGAGRVKLSSELSKTPPHIEQWKKDITNLAEQANGIIVTLVNDGGEYGYETIHTEINMLVQTRLLQKTLFYVPPLTNDDKVQFQKNWDTTRMLLSHYGVHVPNFSERDFRIARGYLLKCLIKPSICVAMPLEVHKRLYFPDDIVDSSSNILTSDILMSLIGKHFYDEAYSKCQYNSLNTQKLSINKNLNIQVTIYRAE
ncbi:MAG: hypothetical protein HC862_29765 [Scytonema sp. RU_4_4]|nr:hypothetical protein [Scytonema sp. RU_4_4]